MWSHTFTAFYSSHSQLYSSDGRNVSSNKEVCTFWLQKSMVMLKKRWGMYNNWNYYPVGFLWSEQLKMFSYSTYPFSLWSTLSISAVTSAISALRRCNKLVKNIVRQRQLIKPWNNPQNKLQLPRLHRLETFTLHSRAELLQKICPVSTEILIILIFIKEEYSCSVTIAWGLNMINWSE